MGAGFRSAMGRIVLDPLGLLGLLTRLREGDLLFVDEIHGLPRFGAGDGSRSGGALAS